METTQVFTQETDELGHTTTEKENSMNVATF